MVYRTFSVLCSNDAHILLSERPAGQGDAYEIVLGGWENTKSALRKFGVSQVYEVNGAVCDSNTFVTLTVSITNGNVIRVSQGANPDQNVIFTFTDDDSPYYPINYISFMTGFGSTGMWRLPSVENPRRIKHKPTDDDQCLQERAGWGS
jgi:hypothetical protein